jgi:hypothetical protein
MESDAPYHVDTNGFAWNMQFISLPNKVFFTVIFSRGISAFCLSHRLWKTACIEMAVFRAGDVEQAHPKQGGDSWDYMHNRVSDGSG